MIIKHEQDSADLTMSRIPVSSRGTGGDDNLPANDGQAAMDGEESKQSA